MLFLLLACADPVEPASYLSVLTINPSHGAVNVPVDADLRVIFSAELDNPSAEQVILSTADGTPVPTALRWFEDNGTILVVDPVENLAINTDFVLVLGGGLDSQVGVLSAEVVSSFSTGSTSEGDSDTDADSDTDTDTDSDADADADSDTDSDADSDVSFEPFAVALEVLASWDGENMVRWADTNGSFQTSYARFTFYEEDYFDAYDDRYACSWAGSIQVQDQADIDVPAYASLRVRFSDAGVNTCSGFPLAWGSARSPAELLSTRDYGLAFTPMSGQMSEELEQAVSDAGLDWETEWEPYVFSTRLALLESSSPEWLEVSYSFALDLNDDGELQDQSIVPLSEGIEGELISSQPWYFSYTENWVD